MKKGKLIIFIILISYITLTEKTYSQIRNELFNRKIISFKKYSIDTSTIKKQILLNKIASTIDTEEVNFHYDIKNVYIVDFDKDKKPDIVIRHINENCDYRDYTEIFLNRGDYFINITPHGFITNIKFNKLGQLTKIISFTEGCCNYPFDDIKEYQFDFKKDSLILIQSIAIPRKYNRNSKFVIPDSFYKSPLIARIKDSTQIFLNPKNETGSYSENIRMLEIGQEVEIIGEKDNSYFVRLKQHRHHFIVPTVICGWVKKKNIKIKIE